jgi:hypothetical protein
MGALHREGKKTLLHHCARVNILYILGLGMAYICGFFSQLAQLDVIFNIQKGKCRDCRMLRSQRTIVSASIQVIGCTEFGQAWWRDPIGGHCNSGRMAKRDGIK